ncbi:MAG: NAD(P)H-dependent oxidoreductase [Patescibacteria group bacterium]|nr:NAD(P)H-dependent oxidoreductase [Patescibacteria group bacterium]
MKKILAIAASPEKGGNSDTLLDITIDTLHTKYEGDIEIEKVYLSDIPMQFYSHDVKYPNTTDEPELVALVEKLQQTDLLVIATPVYNFGVPAILKNFIDRIGYIALDYKKISWSGQPQKKLGYLKVYSIITGGAPNWFQKLQFWKFPGYWFKTAFRYYGAQVIGSSYYGSVTYSHPVKENTKMIERMKSIADRMNV